MKDRLFPINWTLSHSIDPPSAPRGRHINHPARSLDHDTRSPRLCAARERRRAFAAACLDWTERRSHLAGALGAELCDRLFELGWVERRGSGRAAASTDAGEAGLQDLLELDLDRSA